MLFRSSSSMLACCCCCRWQAGALQLLLLLHALEGDWPPSHHHFSTHPEQSNPEEHFQRGFLLPVPFLFLPGPPLQHHQIFSGQPGMQYVFYYGRPGARGLRPLTFLREAWNQHIKFWPCPAGKAKICLISAAPARAEVP